MLHACRSLPSPGLENVFMCTLFSDTVFRVHCSHKLSTEAPVVYFTITSTAVIGYIV